MQGNVVKPGAQEPIISDEMAADRTSRVEAPSARGALLVEHCDVPIGMTLAEWRAERARARRAHVRVGRTLAARMRRALRRRD